MIFSNVRWKWMIVSFVTICGGSFHMCTNRDVSSWCLSGLTSVSATKFVLLGFWVRIVSARFKEKVKSLQTNLRSAPYVVCSGAFGSLRPIQDGAHNRFLDTSIPVESLFAPAFPKQRQQTEIGSRGKSDGIKYAWIVSKELFIWAMIISSFIIIINSIIVSGMESKPGTEHIWLTYMMKLI